MDARAAPPGFSLRSYVTCGLASFLLAACSGRVPTQAATSIDAAAGTVGPADANLVDVYGTMSNDPRCPAQWADLTAGGLPNECAVNGLICVYPEGQGECAPDGSVLKWWDVQLLPGCSEFPPPISGPCSIPGTSCPYIIGPPNPPNAFVIDYCCDGNTGQWQKQPDGGCPNGNVCGTIYASAYDQSCTTDSDCKGVFQGDLCNGCTAGNPNAAINASAYAQYMADLESKVSVTRVCPGPVPPPVVCDAGMCSVSCPYCPPPPPITDAASDSGDTSQEQ